MLNSRQKKLALLAVITILSGISLSAVSSLDANFVLKSYGVLFTCQLGFLLFFLHQIRLGRR